MEKSWNYTLFEEFHPIVEYNLARNQIDITLCCWRISICKASPRWSIVGSAWYTYATALGRQWYGTKRIKKKNLNKKFHGHGRRFVSLSKILEYERTLLLLVCSSYSSSVSKQKLFNIEYWSSYCVLLWFSFCFR